MAIFPQGLTQIDRRCDNAGERAVLRQLKRCLSDDYWVWHNVPVGPRARQPDFVVFSPRRGLLVLEVKHWAWGTLRAVNRDSVSLDLEHGPTTVAHPLMQARGYAQELHQVLQADPALRQHNDPFRGQCAVPYGWGCILSNVRRQQVKGLDFDEVFNPGRTLLRDELDETLDPYEFEKRLWGLYQGWTPQPLTLPQRDRVRWHLFPEIRLQTQQASLDLDTPGLPAPDPLQVMDLQQEQIARTLGGGHRVIHGVAGSGKTMILIFRAQQLAAGARAEQPILVLCYNRALARRIDAQLRERGVDERVVVRTFHAWCEDLVRSYQLSVPHTRNTNDHFKALADTTERAVATGLVPGGQYSALLIDEAHDFEEAWLRLAAAMVSPRTRSLLVLYDDAQSIYQRKRRHLNFAAVGIEARGRTSVLRVNYRNTADVLALALHCTQDLLAPGRPDDGADPDDAPQTVPPASAGRRGPLPQLIKTLNPADEAQAVAERIGQALAEGLAPGDMAVLARTKRLLTALGHTLRRRGVPFQSMHDTRPRDLDWQGAPSVKLLTLHSAKGLEFSWVCILGLQALPHEHEPMDDEARLLYVGMTRATHTLLLACSGDSAMVQRVRHSLAAVS